MKKLLITLLLGLFCLAGFSQTKIGDGVTLYNYSDTLKKDASISQTYYVKDYCVNARLQTSIDTLTDGYLKVRTVIYGSMFYTDSTWTPIDTITSAGKYYATNTKLMQNVYWNYLKITSTAIDSTQYGSFKYRLLIQKN